MRDVQPFKELANCARTLIDLLRYDKTYIFNEDHKIFSFNFEDPHFQEEYNKIIRKIQMHKHHKAAVVAQLQKLLKITRIKISEIQKTKPVKR